MIEYNFQIFREYYDKENRGKGIGGQRSARIQLYDNLMTT